MHDARTRLHLIAATALLAATPLAAAPALAVQAAAPPKKPAAPAKPAAPGAEAAPAAGAHTPLAKAQAAARANAATAEGRARAKRLSYAAGPPLIPILNKCLPDEGEELTAFSIFVRLSQKGRVREVVTDIDAALGACLTAGAAELQLPEAPRDDYWFQVNLAADL